MKIDNRIVAINPDFQLDLSQALITSEFFPSVLPNGTAIIKVKGSLSNDTYAHWYGEKTYDSLRCSLAEVLADEKVSSIIICFNSPGGTVEGLFTCADFIYESRKIKPIKAMVQEKACSAAYLLAAACSKIVATEYAEVGSIGVMARITDNKAFDEKFGIISRIFRSKNAENKNIPLDTEEGQKKLQARLDYYEEKLYRNIARYRNREVKDCMETMGHGDTFMAEDALVSGLIDEISTIEKQTDDQAKSPGEGEEMDISKMTEQEKQNAFNSLLADSPTLAEGIRNEAVAAERARIEQLRSMDNDLTHGIIESAIKEGKTASEIQSEVVSILVEDYRNGRKDPERMKDIVNQQANQQSISVGMQVEKAEEDAQVAKKYAEDLNSLN